MAPIAPIAKRTTAANCRVGGKVNLVVSRGRKGS